MTENHPITPPPELVQQWRKSAPTARDAGATREVWIATQAARWGADQELEACCAAEHTVYGKGKANWLHSLRRPKPPSLAEQGLAALDRLSSGSLALCTNPVTDTHTIRAALERLQELEQSND